MFKLYVYLIIDFLIMYYARMPSGQQIASEPM